MVNFERSKVILPASARGVIDDKKDQLTRDREVGREQAAERAELRRLEAFIATPEWQAERRLRKACIFQLEDLMVRGETIPLSAVQRMWEEELLKPVFQQEAALLSEETLASPPLNRLQVIQGLIWETDRGTRFRFDESGQCTTLDAQGDEQIITLTQDTLIRPAYPVGPEHELAEYNGQITLAEQKQWAQLLNGYQLIQPFPQLHRLEDLAMPEQYASDIAQLYQHWGKHIYDAHFSHMMQAFFRSSLCNLPLPGQTIEIQAQAEIDFRLGVEPRIRKCRAISSRPRGRYVGISQYNLESAIVDQQQLPESPYPMHDLRQRADLAMILRRFEECADDELPDLHLWFSQEMHSPILISTLHEYIECKTALGLQSEFQKLLSDQLWQDEGGKYCRYHNGQWYNDAGETAIVSEQQPIYIVTPEDMPLAEYQRWKKIFGPDHPFSQYWIDHYAAAHDALTELDEGLNEAEYQRRCVVLQRFIDQVPEDIRRRINDVRDITAIFIPHTGHISTSLINGKFFITSELLSFNQEKSTTHIDNIAAKSSKQKWNQTLRCLAYLGNFDPASIDLSLPQTAL